MSARRPPPSPASGLRSRASRRGASWPGEGSAGRLKAPDAPIPPPEAAGLRAGRPQATANETATRLAAPYRRQRPPQPIRLWLDGNESAPPPGELLAELALSAGGALVSRYPDAAPLERDLAARFGVPPEAVLVTAGADEALDRICRAYLGPGLTALTTTPAFAMLPRYVGLAGAAVDGIEWWNGPFPLRPLRRAVADRRPAVVFLTSPANPTGRAIPTSELLDLARSLRGTVLVADLAYVELADEDPTAALLRDPDVLVVRTLSKAWGLAGLRIGYVLGSPDRIESLRAAGGPYPVAAPSLALARAWLRAGERTVDGTVSIVRHQRRVLASRLLAAGFVVPDSQANFVLARGPRAAWLRDALAGLGIATREIDDPDGPGAIRITCPGNAIATPLTPEAAALRGGRHSTDALAVQLGTEMQTGSPAHTVAEARLARVLTALDAALAPDALLLDLDGVLADVRGSYDRAIVTTARSWGVAVTPADIERERHAGRANDDFEVTRRLLAAAGVEAAPREIACRFDELVEGQQLWRHERALVPRRRLAAWGRRLPLAVVTGRPRREAVRFLERFRLAPVFSALVCREDAPFKPDPKPVRQALAILGVTRAWMVGDTPDDIVAARRAGVVPIGIVPPGADAPAAERALLAAGAARVLRDLRDLEDLLP